jgi:hypothetical protein
VTPLVSDPRLAPPTAAFGLAESSLEGLADPFAELVGARGREPVAGPLDSALEQLLERDHRFLLAPTDGDWVAWFENASPPDPRPIAADLPERAGCRTLTVYASPRDRDDLASPLSIVGFTLQEPGRAGLLDAVRVLLVYDDEPHPQTYGDPLPFEDADPEDLGLDIDWLDRYLRALGVRPLDAGFYFPSGATGLTIE